MNDNIEELVPDLDTGELRPISQGAAQAKSAQIEAEPPRTLWQSDASEDSYSSPLAYAGTVFYIREMTEPEVEARSNTTPAFAAFLEVSEDEIKDSEKFAALLEARPELAIKAASWRKQRNEDICLQHVKGWDAPKPFGADAIKDLFPSVQSDLAAAIVQMSTMGAAASFLGQSSSRN